ncbi:MAG: hypothetical protein ACUVRK_03320 [Spirochaetota bacterium]
MSLTLEEAIQQWNLLVNKDEKFNYYLHTIRPKITQILKHKIKQKQDNEEISMYETLICILGYDPNPALILVGALQPKTLVLFYSKQNEPVLHTHFLPTINRENPSIIVIPIELPYTNHLQTMKIIQSGLQQYKNKKALCDITSGKKIQSYLMGLIANDYNLDISYIDSDTYMPNSPIPVPGSETLYIHKAKSHTITEVQLKKIPILAINYIISPPTVMFNLDCDESPYQFINTELSSTSIDTLKTEIEKLACIINNNIQKQLPYTALVHEMASIINSMLIVPELSSMLHKFSHSIVYVDPYLAGIPWELVLNVLYSIHLPIPRVLFKSDSAQNNYNKHTSNREGILFIIGSYYGIDNFYTTITNMIQSTVCKKAKMAVIEATTKGTLQKELGKRQYEIIIYYGHSQFDTDADKTGWLCYNNEVFSCKNFSILKHNPPDILISNSCQSAYCSPFSTHSMAFNALNAGVGTYIGTHFAIEFDKSITFINTFINLYHKSTMTAFEAFSHTLEILSQHYGYDDISLFNYVYYGKHN